MDLSTNDARVALATKWAAKRGLSPYIVCAVVEQESAWNPFAVRFESGFLQRYVKPVNPVAPTTMEIMRACSFGLTAGDGRSGAGARLARLLPHRSL